MQQRRTHHDRTPTLSPATTLIEVMIAVRVSFINSTLKLPLPTTTTWYSSKWSHYL
jgi:hypothetical protein